MATLRGMFLLGLLLSLPTQAFCQQQTQPAPLEIVGTWSNFGHHSGFAIRKIDLGAKTVVASLGRGGDSCGFNDARGVIKMWDGSTLEAEVKVGGCRWPVVFRLSRQEDGRWTGVIENDVRNVVAEGK